MHGKKDKRRRGSRSNYLANTVWWWRLGCNPHSVDSEHIKQIVIISLLRLLLATIILSAQSDEKQLAEASKSCCVTFVKSKSQRLWFYGLSKTLNDSKRDLWLQVVHWPFQSIHVRLCQTPRHRWVNDVTEGMSCEPIVSVDGRRSKKSLFKVVTTVFTVKK